MQLKQHNAFMSAFVLGNLKEAFQQENIGLVFFKWNYTFWATQCFWPAA